MIEQFPIEALDAGLTGVEIIEDVCSRLAAELANSCYLTKLCAYRGYSGKIVAELQLEDFDATGVTAAVTVGPPDPARPSRRYEVEIPDTAPSGARERSGQESPSLERVVDGSVPPVIKKRFYAPREKPAA